MMIFIPFQWTVNGQLRVGFFTSKVVPAGAELTFDYQFQRYGYCFSAVIYFSTVVFCAIYCVLHVWKHLCVMLWYVICLHTYVHKEWMINLLTDGLAVVISPFTFYFICSYSKEAQKCFCGAPSCRGFLGGENRVSVRAAGGKMKKDRSRKSALTTVSSFSYIRKCVLSLVYILLPVMLMWLHFHMRIAATTV